jgi:hypothetical protein
MVAPLMSTSLNEFEEEDFVTSLSSEHMLSNYSMRTIVCKLSIYKYMVICFPYGFL